MSVEVLETDYLMGSLTEVQRRPDGRVPCDLTNSGPVT